MFLAAGSDRSHGGNDGYDDRPDSYYSWDDRVGNYQQPQVGHAVVLRDKQSLLGASVIERIETAPDEKLTHHCPECGTTSIARRTTMHPPFRCEKCRSEFERPRTETVEVTTYKARYDAGWTDLAEVLSTQEINAACVHPKAQNSIRELQWDAFRDAIQRKTGDGLALSPVEARLPLISGGHRRVTVRARIGQAQFRTRLFQRYGYMCAITGAMPAETLEAAHLYRYAEVGEHLDDGGLLLRRDIHRLFDAGLIAIDVDQGVVNVAAELEGYPVYDELHLVAPKLKRPLTGRQRAWLRAHWEQHRTRITATRSRLASDT